MNLTSKALVVAAACLLLWPVLASAAPPSPAGKLVFEDDFSDSKKSGLEDNLQATDYSRGFHAPGVYHLKDIKENTTNWELFPNQSYGEFSYQADVWDNSDDISTGDLAGGLVFRATDETHFYAVLIDPRKGEYSVRKQDGAGKWTDLIATKPSPLIKQQADVNLLRLDGIGDTFNIYLNGAALDSFKDGSYTFGMLGMIVANVDATEPHMHFDNIKIYSTEQASAPTQQASTPARLPRSGEAGNAPALLLVCGLGLLLLGLGLRQRAYKG